jgi:RNA polymerase sigma-70 factor (ECF subfamily)
MPLDEPSSHDLALAWVERRDEGAAGELMRRLHPLVAGIARRHLPFLPDIEDVVQETWMRVFDHLPRWSPHRPLEAWVARIAVNVCLKKLRTRRRKPLALWSELSPGEQAAALSLQATGSGAEGPLAPDARELLHRLLDTLDANDRQIITLLHLEERTLEEAAALLGASKTLLKVRAFRARAKLRAALEKLEPPSP